MDDGRSTLKFVHLLYTIVKVVRRTDWRVFALQRNAVREATAFLLDALQDDKPEHAMLQTKVRAMS